MTYLFILFLLIISELLYFRIADHYNIIDKPNMRSSHTRITLRGGGIIFYLGALVYFIASGFSYPWFFVGLTLISLISFIDDVHSVSQRTRLIVHFVSMALMFYQWGLFTEQVWWLSIIALIVCTGIINAYNFMDGINGITGGYSLSILLVLAYVNEYVTAFVDIEMIRIAIIAVLIFCFFNFRKKAKCFAGDVGSVSIAFILLFLMGRLMLQTHDFSWIILLAVYGVDSVLTIIHRIMLHENIGLPHRKHAYQLMANELKIPHVIVSSIYMILQFIISFGLIYTIMPRWIYCCCIVVLLSFIYVIFMKKYYHLHEEYLQKQMNQQRI